jgi:hypothetical protein
MRKVVSHLDDAQCSALLELADFGTAIFSVCCCASASHRPGDVNRDYAKSLI